jgi:serine/threonine-protein kinase
MENGDPVTSLLGNRYQIQGRLGTGGMSVVYQARDLMLERPVAIKLLRQDYSKDPGFRNSFRQEAKAAANLSHPNIVTVHDFGFDSGRLYLVMEYIPGTDLKSIIRKTGQFSIEDTIPLIVQACAGIGYAHRAGLIHCDIKPHNILVTPDQRLKVTDFGIARALATIHPDEKSEVVWGSPQYFSPEQANGTAPSPASDVYSLGVIMYEMLAGQLPFISDDPAELSRMHREMRPVPISHLNHSISPELEQIINKILSKEASNRYRSADQLGRILVSFIHPVESYNSVLPSLPSPVSTQPELPIQTPVGSIPASQSAPIPQPRSVQINRSPATPSLLPQGPGGRPAQTSGKRPGFDWMTIGLGLIAALFLSGLVPFWLYVWFRYNSIALVR